MMRLMFSRRWLSTTFLVFLGAIVCFRLGVWQLDRLQQRKAFNAHVLKMQSLPPLDLNQTVDPNILLQMEYRAAFAHGYYDYSSQVALRNQYHEGQYGYHLLTPLVINENLAVLVDRGWIPAENNDSPSDWQKYNQGKEASVKGILRLGQNFSQSMSNADPHFWIAVNLQQIQAHMPYTLLPVYLQLDPKEGDVQPPIPYQPDIEITEGPHLGYAIQWFFFGSLLLFGYPFYLKKQEQVLGSNHRNAPNG